MSICLTALVQRETPINLTTSQIGGLPHGSENSETSWDNFEGTTECTTDGLIYCLGVWKVNTHYDNQHLVAQASVQFRIGSKDDSKDAQQWKVVQVFCTEQWVWTADINQQVTSQHWSSQNRV
jgi:hypothetical protein